MFLYSYAFSFIPAEIKKSLIKFFTSGQRGNDRKYCFMSENYKYQLYEL